jgi:hypothetical protein
MNTLAREYDAGEGEPTPHSGRPPNATFPTWLWAIVISIVIAAFGGIYNLSQTVGAVNDKLDRNCRIIVTLEQDIRFHVVTTEHGGRKPFAPFPEVSC